MNTGAFEEGYKAYENYQHLSDNPYSLDSLEHFAWEMGYKVAKYSYQE